MHFYPEDRPRIQEGGHEPADPLTVYDEEYRILRPDGSPALDLGSGIRIRDAFPARIQSYRGDRWKISPESKRVEAELIDSERRYQSAVRR